MGEYDQLRRIISENYDNIAFIVGNGIHRYYNNNAMSWKNLLKELWKQYVDESLSNFPSEGISNIEFYDLVELNYMRSFTTTNYPYKLRTYNQSVDSSKIDISKLKSAEIITAQAVKLNSNPNNIQFNTKNLKSYIDTLKNFSDNLRRNINPECQDLSDADIVIRLSHIISNESIRRIYMNSIKKQIAEKMYEWENNNVATLVQYIRDINAPIMTTNYDKILEKSFSCKKFIKKKENSNEDINKRNFSDYYPWNIYYSDGEKTDFGIWHINGILDYPRSIKLGLCDYMGCVEKARKMIQGRSVFEIEAFEGKNTNYWSGYNTWLHYIFNKDLFIFGLGLNEDEVFLRWLLIQRAKYSTIAQRPVKGWYVDRKINYGKKIFLEALGFEVVEIEDYKVLYEDIWK